MQRLALYVVLALVLAELPAGAISNSGATFETGIDPAPSGVSVRAAVGRVQTSSGSHPGPPGGRPDARDIRCWWLLKQGAGDDDSEGYVPVTPRREGMYYTRCIEFVGGVAQQPDLQPPTLTPWPGDPPGAHTGTGIVEDAVNAIVLNTPNLATSPPDATTYVNIPTYFAVTNDVGGGSATAQVDNNAVWATARAELVSVEFDFDDGTEPLACETLGTLWDPAIGGEYEDQPAECPHTYADPGDYEIGVTLIWDIYYRSSDAPGEQLWGQHSRTATHPLLVNELEAVTY